MFDPDFYPTPPEVIARMISTNDLTGRTVLEPSAGKGDLIDALKAHGATVICCELHPDLAILAGRKARLIAGDFLTVTSDQVSHIDAIYMNPPFSRGADHILHAWSIAPGGCHIVALCNSNTLTTEHTRQRRELNNLISQYGNQEHLGDVFQNAERSTGVKVALINLYKPGISNDFSEFFSTQADEPELSQEGIMSYNAVRDVVNRYVNAVRLYDQVLDNAVQMNALVGELGVDKLTFNCRQGERDRNRAEFRVELQKKAWRWIFSKMDMEKYTTKRLREGINRFIENQQNVPFTMRNIYRMFEMVVGTHAGRMDDALVDIFDKLTRHYHDNRHSVEGWKTNSHYFMGRKYILPYMAEHSWSGGMTARCNYSQSNAEYVEDFVKALCYLTGRDYNKQQSLYDFTHQEFNNPETGKRERVKYEFGMWYEWGFFRFKGFKKGTMHFEFLDESVWAVFNQHIARIKGYPLPESIRRSANNYNKEKNYDSSPDSSPAPSTHALLAESATN